MKYFVSFVMAMVLVVASCQTVPMTGRRQLSMVPSANLMAMSYTQYDQFLNENKLSSNDQQTQMVKNTGARIQKAVEMYMEREGLSDRLNDFKWEFNLVASDAVNAWCMPGGKVVFYEGIMPICQDEDGVAVVMGHEIAHAIAGHGGERMSQGLMAQGLSTTLDLATMNQSPTVRGIFNTSFGLASNVGMLAFSRQHESEADKMGLIFSSMAGYNPEAAPAFWQRMASQSGGQAPPEFLSTHPSHDRRIRDLQALMPEAKGIYNQYKK